MSGVSRPRFCAMRARENLNVHLIGRATKTKIELDQDYIDERLPVAGREMIYRRRKQLHSAECRHEYPDAGVGAGRHQRGDGRFTGAVLRQW